jgi:NAD-dependent SIR2 family protein deacetylase
MWQHYPALGRLRMGFSSIANPEAFENDPTLAWGFYGHRLLSYRNTQPHQGFNLLKKLGERFTHGSFIFTSNVDGQFQKAGFDPQRIYECHGSIHTLQCAKPDDCCKSTWLAIDEQPVIDIDACELTSALPKCLYCGGLARPNILMFDDWFWQARPYQQQKKRLEQWLTQVEAPLVIEIGAGVAIPTVRHFSERVANNGERLIRINPADATIPLDNGVSLAMGGLAGINVINAVLSQ